MPNSLKVSWNQLRRLLNVEETFAQTGNDYESYTILDRYAVFIKHDCYDGEWYPIEYVQLLDPKMYELDGITCCIQLTGCREEPLNKTIKDGEFEIEIYARCTPPMILAP